MPRGVREVRACRRKATRRRDALHPFLISVYLIAQTSPPSSSWVQCVEGPRPWTSVPEVWGRGLAGEEGTPQVSLDGKRTLQEGRLENIEGKLGCSHLISLFHFPWRRYSLERCERGNMEGFSRSRIWARCASVHRWAHANSHTQASSRQGCPELSFTWPVMPKNSLQASAPACHAEPLACPCLARLLVSWQAWDERPGGAG